MANIAKELLYLVTPAKTAGEMWSILKDTYQITNPQAILNLKNRYQNFKMEKSMSLEMYIKQHESLVDQLRAHNQPVDEGD